MNRFEELAEIRSQLKIEESKGYPDNHECPLLYPGMKCRRKALIEHIDSQAAKIKLLEAELANTARARDNYYTEITRLEKARAESEATWLDNLAETIKKQRANRYSWLWIGFLLGCIFVGVIRCANIS